MTSYELTYAKPDDPLAKRVFMRCIENLSGRRRLIPIYRRWQASIAAGNRLMWSTVLDMIGTRLEVEADPGWQSRIPTGPLVVIANHPFGIADGIAILALAERLGRPYRILINADFMRVPEIQPLGLPIDFAETKAALETNLKTRAEARRLLKEGVTIIVFPAGGVATAESPFGHAEELPWKQFVVRLIQQTSATVLPVYFEGQNSPLFHFVSRYSLTLRLSLLVCELRYKLGSTVRARVGQPVAYEAIGANGKGRELLEELYLLVHRLAPGADGKDRALLLPRPPEERRRYPWDPPLDHTTSPKRTTDGSERSPSVTSEGVQP